MALPCKRARNVTKSPPNAVAERHTTSPNEDEIPADVAASRFKEEGLIADAGSVGRDWTMTDYRWNASLLCHGPVLFGNRSVKPYLQCLVG